MWLQGPLSASIRSCGVCLQGHFVGVKTEGGARVAVCEGDKKAFGAKFIKAGGKKIKAFKAGGCLGTSSFIGKPYNKSSDAIELAWPADMPQVSGPILFHSPPVWARHLSTALSPLHALRKTM